MFPFSSICNLMPLVNLMIFNILTCHRKSLLTLRACLHSSRHKNMNQYFQFEMIKWRCWSYSRINLLNLRDTQWILALNLSKWHQPLIRHNHKSITEIANVLLHNTRVDIKRSLTKFWDQVQWQRLNWMDSSQK